MKRQPIVKGSQVWCKPERSGRIYMQSRFLYAGVQLYLEPIVEHQKANCWLYKVCMSDGKQILSTRLVWGLSAAKYRARWIRVERNWYADLGVVDQFDADPIPDSEAT